MKLVTIIAFLGISNFLRSQNVAKIVIKVRLGHKRREQINISNSDNILVN